MTTLEQAKLDAYREQVKGLLLYLEVLSLALRREGWVQVAQAIDDKVERERESATIINGGPL